MLHLLAEVLCLRSRTIKRLEAENRELVEENRGLRDVIEELDAEKEDVEFDYAR